MEELGLELYGADKEACATISAEVKRRLWCEAAIEKCLLFPQAFRVIPKKNSCGFVLTATWAHYEFDESTELVIDCAHPEALHFFKTISAQERTIIMSQALATKENDTIKALLGANIKAIKSVLPKHLTPERALRIAYTAICKNPTLARCTQLSLMNAVIEASMLGLEIGGPLGHCHLVPFSNKGTMESQLIVDYKGKIQLAYNSGKVKTFSGHAVFEKDAFEYSYGLHPTLTHKPSREACRGKLVAAYAMVSYFNGGEDFEVIEQADADRAKSKSKTAQKDERDKTSYSLWNSDDDEPTMWVKTAFHRLFKRIPKSAEMMRLDGLESSLERGEPQHIANILDGEFSITEAPPKPELPPAGGEPGPAPTSADGPEAKKAAGKKKEVKQAAPPATDQAPATEQGNPTARQFFAMKKAIPEGIYKKALDNKGIKNDDLLDEAQMKAIMSECGRLVDQEAA